MPRPLIGGQAVFEGVMMRSPKHVAVAVRTPKGKIEVEHEKLSPLGDRYPIFKKPFLRGVIALWENLAIGFKAMITSTNAAADEDEQLTKKELFFTIAFAVGLSVSLFIILPLVISNFLTQDRGIIFNIIDGVLRIVIFLAYLLFISLFKDVRRIFQYHGAEHMSVHAYEAGKKLTVKAVKPFTTLHPRCGTSFLLIVVILSIAVFSIIQTENIVQKFLWRLVLIPVIAGISFELLRYGAKFSNNMFVKPFLAPGLMLQMITTKRPDNGQIEVAIAALKEVDKREAH